MICFLPLSHPKCRLVLNRTALETIWHNWVCHNLSHDHVLLDNIPCRNSITHLLVAVCKNVTTAAFVTEQKEENLEGPQMYISRVLDKYCGAFVPCSSTEMKLNHSSTGEHGGVPAIYSVKTHQRRIHPLWFHFCADKMG